MELKQSKKVVHIHTDTCTFTKKFMNIILLHYYSITFYIMLTVDCYTTEDRFRSTKTVYNFIIWEIRTEAYSLVIQGSLKNKN